jgi:hypothetical protein
LASCDEDLIMLLADFSGQIVSLSSKHHMSLVKLIPYSWWCPSWL